MKKTILILCLIIAFISCSKPQAPLPDVVIEGFTKHEIEGIGSVQIPPSMRLDTLKEDNLDVYDAYADERIVFRQSESQDENGNDRYARVSVVRIDSESLSQKDIARGTKEELSEVNAETEPLYRLNLRNMNMEITKWETVSVRKIGSKYCMVLKYYRTSSFSSITDVCVELLIFPMGSSNVVFTLSYRISDGIWEEYFKNIARSINVN